MSTYICPKCKAVTSKIVDHDEITIAICSNCSYTWDIDDVDYTKCETRSAVNCRACSDSKCPLRIIESD